MNKPKPKHKKERQMPETQTGPTMLTTMFQVAERRKREAWTKYRAMIRKPSLTVNELEKGADYLQQMGLNIAWHDVFSKVELDHDTAEVEAAKTQECSAVVAKAEAAHKAALDFLASETARLQAAVEVKRGEEHHARLELQKATEAASLAASLRTMFAPLFDDGGIEGFRLPLDAHKLPVAIRILMVGADLIDPRGQRPVALTEPPRPEPERFMPVGFGGGKLTKV